MAQSLTKKTLKPPKESVSVLQAKNVQHPPTGCLLYSEQHYYCLMKCKELGRDVQCRGCSKQFEFFPSEQTARAQLSLHFPACPSCGFESVVKLTPTEVRVLQTYIG